MTPGVKHRLIPALAWVAAAASQPAHGAGVQTLDTGAQSFDEIVVTGQRKG